MSDVTLSAAVRSSLLSLQNTTDLIDRTQGRLSTGLRVANAIDDPVSFFQAKTLNDRAFDFGEKKDGIDQGISTVSAALEGIENIENIVRQLKGIATNLKSATGTQFTDLVTQFNSLRTQIGLLADDATYQGVNLVNNTTETLSVSFSEKTGSLLSVNAVNVRESGLSVDKIGVGASTPLLTGFNYVSAAAFTVTAGASITVTYQGTAQTLDNSGVTTIALSYGTVSLTIQAGTALNQSISQGDILTLSVQTSATAFANGSALAALFTGTGAVGVSVAALTTVFVDSSVGDLVNEGNTSEIDAVIDGLDSALTTLRSNAQTLGSNVALLQTRLDFTDVYVNTLETGAAKLTLADINEEGANLLALQTRQQLGISALAFAGQAEQGILSLFR